MAERVWASKALFLAIKGAGRPAYRIATETALSPQDISKLIRGAIPVRPDDPRVLRLAAAVGLPAAKAFSRRPPMSR
jgi:hypothetical protein